MRHPRFFGLLKSLAWTSLLLLLCSVAASAAPRATVQHKELARRVDTILERADVVRGFWGIEIEDLDTGEVLYSHEADRLFSPASNTKLFTTSAALALIGPNYRFRTTIESAAPPDPDGRLGGDLVLVGRGDPTMSGRALPFNLKTERPFDPAHVIEELADQVVARGVKVIDGDVVADDSFYVYEPYGQGWAQEDLLWESGAPVSALAVNDNVVYFNIRPAANPGEPALVTASPFAGDYLIDNLIRTSPARTGPRKISIDRRPGSNRVQLWGTIPADDPGTSEALAVEDPAQWCARLLAELLAQRGVVLRGHTRAHHLERDELNTANTGAAPSPQPVVLASHDSPPLGVDIRVINKVSQNLHAEMLLRLLGHEKGTSGSVAAGLEVVRGFLTRAGLLPEEYVFYDGSGLSRLNLVSPRATVTLLRYAASQPWGAEFLDTLPLAGVDGTLSGRFKSLPAGAQLHAKTGTLDHVNVLSGYLTTATGQRLVFSILGNHHTMSGHQAGEVIDRIVLEAERTRN